VVTDSVAIVVAVISALGSGGAWLQGRVQVRTQRNERRDRAAEILAAVKALLDDTTPDPLGLFATEEKAQKAFAAIEDRWQRCRIPLLTLAYAHPSKRVRDLASRLEAATSSSLAQTALFIGRVVRSPEFDNARQEANRMHGNAVSLLDHLEQAIQRA